MLRKRIHLNMRPSWNYVLAMLCMLRKNDKMAGTREHWNETEKQAYFLGVLSAAFDVKLEIKEQQIDRLQSDSPGCRKNLE